ncbi:nickel ABC transporter substrate-binding protein [Bacillus sp. 179-C3.3 HS]|uniref:nickel ABC transporter substrate-binding protein n=1 Tax=Bacillus sp. 179-C3.3 HS TaxID=3232162 RepID=UPI0039A2C105
MSDDPVYIKVRDKRKKPVGQFAMMIVSILACILLASCTDNNTSTDVNGREDDDELVFASTKDIRDLNPHLYGGEMAAQNMVFESLVVNTEKGIQPALAKSWDISEDGKTYTFHLRKGVTFSDGEPFHAKAVKLNIDAVLENMEKNAWLNLVTEIQSTKAVDEYTFVLTLKNPYYPTLEELGLTRPFRFISPKSFIDGTTANGVEGYAGTGPYVLKEHKKNQYAIFEKNDQYWGKKPKISRVKWNVMPDHQTILLALQKGEIDLLYGADGDMVDGDSFQALKKDGQYGVSVSPPTGSRSIVINSNQPITKDPKVREAFQYAVQKEMITEGILNGTEQVAHTLLAPTIPYADIRLTKKTYQKTKAETLLDAAGWKLKEDGYRYKHDKLLSVTIYYNSDNAGERTISESIQHDFKQVGIKLHIRGEEKQAYLDRQKTGKFDLMYSLSWGLPYDPQTYVSSFRVASHADYQAQLGLEKKKWLDETITNVLIEPDVQKRKQMYRDIFTYIHDENVYIPLSYSVTKAVYQQRLKGVGFHVSQYEIPFDTMYFSS